MGRFVGGKKAPEAEPAREGTVIFATATRKNITPGQWKPEDGPATNMRWWDFLKTEKMLRERTPIRLEYRYDKDRNRIED